MRLREIARRTVPSVSVESSVHAAAIQMAAARAELLAVTDHDVPVGTLSAYDIATRAVAYSVDPQRTTVRQVMTPCAVTASGNTDVRDAAVCMQVQQLSRLLVADRDSSRLGIVTWKDLQSAGADPELTGRLVLEGRAGQDSDRQGGRGG